MMWSGSDGREVNGLPAYRASTVFFLTLVFDWTTLYLQDKAVNSKSDCTYYKALNFV